MPSQLALRHNEDMFFLFHRKWWSPAIIIITVYSGAIDASAQHISASSPSAGQTVLLNEGDFFSKSALPPEILPDKDHPLARKLIASDEGEISCEPVSEKILVAHYRAEPTAEFSMKDDRVLIAVKQADKFEILKVLQSDTVVADGRLSSINDFEEEFITIEGVRFLYIRTRVSGSGGMVDHNIYTISSDRKLSVVPFEDVRKSSLLKDGEELRNGDYRFAKGTFTFESGIYKPEDGESCPSLGDFDAQFRLQGKFNQKAYSHTFEPDFRLVVATRREAPPASLIRPIRKSVG